MLLVLPLTLKGTGTHFSLGAGWHSFLVRGSPLCSRLTRRHSTSCTVRHSCLYAVSSRRSQLSEEDNYNYVKGRTFKVPLTLKVPLQGWKCLNSFSHYVVGIFCRSTISFGYITESSQRFE